MLIIYKVYDSIMVIRQKAKNYMMHGNQIEIQRVYGGNQIERQRLYDKKIILNEAI